MQTRKGGKKNRRKGQTITNHGKNNPGKNTYQDNHTNKVGKLQNQKIKPRIGPGWGPSGEPRSMKSHGGFTKVCLTVARKPL